MEIKEIFSKSLSDGRLVFSKLFLELFSEYPSVHTIVLPDNYKINLETINDDQLKQVFSEYKYSWKSTVCDKRNTSAVDDEDNDDDLIIVGSTYADYSITVIYKQFICCLFTTKMVFYYKNCTETELNLEIESIINNLPHVEKNKDTATIQLVANDGRDFYTIKSKIAKSEININDYYNDDFQGAYNQIEKFLNSRESGLVLIHGKAGTGKTSAIRKIITAIPNEYILIPNGMMSYLAAPEFIGFIMDHKNSIFILEDCEQILTDRKDNQFNSGISTILNMSDGLLSDIFNLKFICTFNADMTTIDSALLRKGRCYCNYEFKPLNANKIEKLAKIHNIELKEVKDMTLAELFNINVDINVPVVKKKIGL